MTNLSRDRGSDGSDAAGQNFQIAAPPTRTSMTATATRATRTRRCGGNGSSTAAGVVVTAAGPGSPAGGGVAPSGGGTSSGGMAGSTADGSARETDTGTGDG